MDLIIVGNYPADGQRSMEGFARLMAEVMRERGVRCELRLPPVRLGRLVTSRSGFAKWVGYVDKFIFFTIELAAIYWRRRLSSAAPVKVHIADHGNAIYALMLPRSAVVITCHDMLAVRAALGDSTTACTATRMGKVFQWLIRKGIGRAERVACVSNATLADYSKIIGGRVQRVVMIHSALNARFLPLPSDAVVRALGARLPFTPYLNYLFHVGSAHPRKNRVALVQILSAMRAHAWDGWLVFAGAVETEDIRSEVDRLGVRNRIVCLGSVTQDELNALYAGALAFIFPSISEGFGWPPVEANASGCPVIASNTTSLPEVCGQGAQLFAPFDVEHMAEAALALRSDSVRAHWVKRGRENAARFSRTSMGDAYVALYN